MSLKIYLAARYSKYPILQRFTAVLEKSGHFVTSRWINGNHQISDDGLSAQAKEKERVRFALEDLEDLYEADCLICFTETPRPTTTRGGRHVEYGIALALGMRIIVIGPRENVFHCLPTIEQYESIEEFLKNAGTLDKSPSEIPFHKKHKCMANSCKEEAVHHYCDDHMDRVREIWADSKYSYNKG